MAQDNTSIRVDRGPGLSEVSREEVLFGTDWKEEQDAPVPGTGVRRASLVVYGWRDGMRQEIARYSSGSWAGVRYAASMIGAPRPGQPRSTDLIVPADER